MSTSSHTQYTRKLRISHLVIALFVAAGCLPAHSASTAPASAAPQGSIDDPFYDPWLDELELILEILWQVIQRYPPPKLEEPEMNLWAFVNGYAAEGILDDLTQEEREYYTGVTLDFIDHLELHPNYFEPELYDAAMNTAADILDDLGVLGSE